MDYKPDWGKDERVKRMIKTYPERYTEKFWRTLDPFFNEKNNFSFLDAGCGPGLLLADVKKRFPGVVLTGLDEQEKMLEEARARNPGTDFFDVQLGIDFIHSHDRRYDVIFVGFLFHEIEEPLGVFEAVKEYLLTATGKLVIYDFIFSPIKDYLEYGRHKGNLTGAIKRFPKPAKYSLNDIGYLLELVGYRVLVKQRVTPVAGVVISTV